MKYIKSDYVPKGDLTGLPLEIIDKMIERQEEQGNKPDVSVFENDISSNASKGGFNWDRTVEEGIFWCDVMIGENFDLFFKKYPKKEYSKEYPKVMMVWDSNEKNAKQRVVLMEKNGGYLAWSGVETFEEAKEETSTVFWEHAKDIEPENEPQLISLTIKDISSGKGVGVDPKLIRIKQ